MAPTPYEDRIDLLNNNNNNTNGIKIKSAGDSGEEKEFRSSFPQIQKFVPSERGVPLQSALDWLNDKRKADELGSNNLWRVHDSIYNLEDFISRHPGGKEWIEMTRGTDITELYESSHFINMKQIDKILEKYYISPAKTQRNSPYTFEENGFYRTVKRRIEPILKEIGTSPCRDVLIMQDLLSLTFILTSLFSVWTNSWPFKILAGLFLTLSTISAHNFTHLKDNWRKYYFDLSFFSSYEWIISHIFSHHSFPNTVLDAEISRIEPVLEFLPLRPKNWFQRYFCFFYAHIVFPFFFGSEFFTRIFKAYKGTYKMRPENYIVFIQLFFFALFAPSLSSAIISWFFIQSVASYCFAAVGLFAAHHHTDIFHDGDEPRKDTDFGLCQIDATRDRKDSFENSFIVLTSFGEHTLHHLFPTICHSKLKHIKPIVKKTMDDFNIKFQPLTKWEFFKGTHQTLARIKPNFNTRKARIIPIGLK